jgi:hypothetical protein
MLTVEELRNRAVVAHCHQTSYTSVGDFEMRVELWRDDAESWTAA